jgi:hypothetical protein
MPVSYDSKGKVIRPFTQHEWTHEMVIEYAKCARSVKYFALNHCKVVHPVKGVIPLELRDYQMEILDLLEHNQKLVINCPRQVGKCCSEDNLIRLKNKTTGKIITYKIGDFFELVKCNKNH